MFDLIAGLLNLNILEPQQSGWYKNIAYFYFILSFNTSHQTINLQLQHLWFIEGIAPYLMMTSGDAKSISRALRWLQVWWQGRMRQPQPVWPAGAASERSAAPGAKSIVSKLSGTAETTAGWFWGCGTNKASLGVALLFCTSAVPSSFWNGRKLPWK